MSNPENNKVHYDLENVHIAPMLTTGATPTWDDFFPLPGAISIDLAAQGDVVKLRADGMDYYVAVSNNGYQGDLNLAMVTDQFRIKVLGETLSEKDKVLVENALVKCNPFALSFQFKGDSKHRRHVLYNCVANRPGIKGENKDSQKTPDTESIAITASPLADGKVKASTTEATPAAVYDAWNTKVWVSDTTAAAGA